MDILHWILDYSLIFVYVLILVVFPLVWYSYNYIVQKRKKQTERYRELASFVPQEFGEFQNKHEDYSEAKALRIFFSNSKVYLEALKLQGEHERRLKAYEDQYKNIKIANRLFSYDYEETIYEIFSKTAWYFITDNPLQMKFVTYSSGYIKKDEFIDKLSSKLKLSKNEADNLYNEFLNKRIIDETDKGNCGIGFTLSVCWNVISPNDLNFTRWMKAHPEIKARGENIDEIKNKNIKK